MDDKDTHSLPIEPTTPVEPDYVKAYTSGLPLPQSDPTMPRPYYGDDYVDIPPPPPKSRRVSLGLLVVCLVIAILLFLSSVLFYLARTYEVSKEVPTPIVRFVLVTPTTQPTMPPTPTPTARPYTAQDILNEMIAHNLRVDGPAYGESLAYFFVDPIYNDVVNIPFQSSAIWGEAGQGAGGYCDSCAGLWVYSSYDVATVVEHKLVTDGSIAEQTPAQGPTAYPVVTHHGRCVANGVSGTPYAEVIKQYCV